MDTLLTRASLSTSGSWSPSCRRSTATALSTVAPDWSDAATATRRRPANAASDAPSFNSGVRFATSDDLVVPLDVAPRPLYVTHEQRGGKWGKTLTSVDEQVAEAEKKWEKKSDDAQAALEELRRYRRETKPRRRTRRRRVAARRLATSAGGGGRPGACKVIDPGKPEERQRRQRGGANMGRSS